VKRPVIEVDLDSPLQVNKCPFAISLRLVLYYGYENSLSVDLLRDAVKLGPHVARVLMPSQVLIKWMYFAGDRQVGCGLSMNFLQKMVKVERYRAVRKHLKFLVQAVANVSDDFSNKSI
jgi:hypothetical protein